MSPDPKFRRCIGTIARYLMRRGIWFLITDCRSEDDMGRRHFRPFNMWFAKGDLFEDRTDVLGSELFMLEL